MSNNQLRQGARAVFSALLLPALVVVPAGAWSFETARAPAAAIVEAAFSPGPGAEQLVIKHIDAAGASIRLLAYSFTSAPIAQALIRAKKRGVALAVDRRQNIELDASGKARAALSALANAGITVRAVSTFTAHHDKVVVVDGKHVQTGSFNYRAVAAKSNSENAPVVWNNPDLAKAYLQHLQRKWDKGEPLVLAY